MAMNYFNDLEAELNIRHKELLLQRSLIANSLDGSGLALSVEYGDDDFSQSNLFVSGYNKQLMDDIKLLKSNVTEHLEKIDNDLQLNKQSYSCYINETMPIWLEDLSAYAVRTKGKIGESQWLQDEDYQVIDKILNWKASDKTPYNRHKSTSSKVLSSSQIPSTSKQYQFNEEVDTPSRSVLASSNPTIQSSRSEPNISKRSKNPVPAKRSIKDRLSSSFSNIFRKK